MMNTSIGQWSGGSGTGTLGGPPSGHNYKRAVYRPPPKEFSVEVLSPNKFGNGYCYGMRIIPIRSRDSDTRSARSGSSHHEYEVWRRWEDCLWFQEILESEYALMSRQKRARLAAGKGVKKNGVYSRSDMASSWDSLPPGPDAKTIAKDIHQLVPRLTKKGTLFRASQATIEQRGKEFQAFIHALFQEDQPVLVKELREIRFVRDFFGYWRRDLDHARKRHSTGKDTSHMRRSIASSMLAMYFSAYNTSLHLTPSALDAELPPSPAPPKFQSSRFEDSSRRTSPQRDEFRRRSSGRTPVLYATSDSSASTVSVASTNSRGPQQSPTDMTFYVSNRGSLALNVSGDDEGTRANYINPPSSASACMQPTSWPRDVDDPFPSQDEEILNFTPERPKTQQDPNPPEFHIGLQALPEDCELVPTAAIHSEIEEVPRAPVRRPRNNSCSDRSHRQCFVFPVDGLRSAPVQAVSVPVPDRLRLDTDVRHLAEDATTSSSSRPSSVAWSGFSCEGATTRTSWRTSMASDASFAHSFATSFADGSCADFDRQSTNSFATSFGNGSCADIDRERAREAHRSMVSLASSGRRTALGHRDSMTSLNSLLSDLSLDSRILTRNLIPPSASYRRALSAGSERPSSIIAALNGQEDWYEQQEDLIDTYFYDPGMQTTKPHVDTPQTPSQQPPLELSDTDASTPIRFLKPFQNCPPGQFHLPWTPPSSPESLTPPSTPPPVRTTRTPPQSASPNSPSTFQDSVTLKACLADSIVLLRIPRAAPLSEVRMRLRDKYAAQEGVQLSRAFVIGWSLAQGSGMGPLRGRPRANSASSVGTLNPQALRYVYTEEEWREAVAACMGGKMMIRLFNAQPI